MTTDARVELAIAHWAPRFVANGVALADFEEITQSIGSWNDWCRAWCERAALLEQMGREALAKRKLLSAGEHLQRAGVRTHRTPQRDQRNCQPHEPSHRAVSV